MRNSGNSIGTTVWSWKSDTEGRGWTVADGRALGRKRTGKNKKSASHIHNRKTLLTCQKQMTIKL